MILGRKSELQYLTSCYQKGKNQLIVLYGCENIGKTALLKEFCKDKESVYYEAVSCSEKEQKNLFAQAMQRRSGLKLTDVSFDASLRQTKPKNGDRQIFIVEEISNIVKGGLDFMESLDKLLNGVFYEEPVMVIVTSSSVSWVENDFVRSIGSYAYKISGFLKVKDLRFVDSVHYFEQYSVQDCIEAYGILGGIPGLLAQWDKEKTVKENICSTILQKKSYLYEAASSYVGKELRETGVYNTILAALALGKSKLNDLYEETGFSRAKISVYLKTLIEMEIVEKVFSFQTRGHANTQKGIYRIKNHLLNFWFKFVYPNLTQLELMDAESFYDTFIAPDYMKYMERYYIDVCREYLELMNQAGRLQVQFTRIGSWYGKQGDIHIMAQDEQGHYLLGQCCWEKECMTVEDYEKMLECVKQAKIKNVDYYYLFSRYMYDVHLKDMAKTEPEIILIGLDKL